MKSIEWRIRPGKAINEEEMVRSFKEKGYYDRGIPRTKEPVVQKTPTPPKKLPPWPSKRVLRYMDRATFEKFMSDREKELERGHQEPNGLSDERRST